ncbi:MAG: hypothetical protein ABI831_27475 [Betaproteobacteria bacterium]
MTAGNEICQVVIVHGHLTSTPQVRYVIVWLREHLAQVLPGDKDAKVKEVQLPLLLAVIPGDGVNDAAARDFVAREG